MFKSIFAFLASIFLEVTPHEKGDEKYANNRCR